MFGIIQIFQNSVLINLFGLANYSQINNIQTLHVLIIIYIKIQYLISSKVHLVLVADTKFQTIIQEELCLCGVNTIGVMQLMDKHGHVLLEVLKECGILNNQQVVVQHNTIKWNLLCVNFINKVYILVQLIQTGHVLVILNNDF